MEEKLNYEKLMEENNLKLSDLPEDAQYGIEAILNIKKSIKNFFTSRNLPVTDKVKNKLKANDKWVTNEIKEMLGQKNLNTTPNLPNPADAVIADIKGDASKANTTPTATTPATTTPVVVLDTVKTEDKPDARGVKADAELKELLKDGKNKLTLDELEKQAKSCYDIIFDTYKDGEENGFETSYYRVIETEKKVFTISKI